MKISNRLPMLAAIVGMTSACGSTAPTQQLVDARTAMNEARASEASELTPDKLLTAKQALAQAEKAHEEDAGSDKEAHLAYLASRKAQIAMAAGKIAAAKATETQAEASYQAGLERTARTSSSKLESTSNKLESTQAELQAEQQRRAEAELRAAAALASLAKVAQVRAESRGTVITLPGGVLFPSGGSDLSPTARVALDQVASALSEQPIESKIVVEGHTDDRGSDANNQLLSQARAESVRSFLLQKGLEADRVVAVGKGESQPIASNDTAEGRATNRRVDLVVSDPNSTNSPQANTASPAQPSSAASQ